VVVLLLVVVQVLAELVDDGGEGVNLSELANWGNVCLVLEVIEEGVVDVGGECKCLYWSGYYTQATH
jgi:hypothetical protein